MIKIGTHDGAFHCDEVLACVLLKTLPRYANAEIVRSRDPEILKDCDIVVDVGGVFDPSIHRYDHHQKNFNESVSTLLPGKPWTTKLSSAGLIYVHFGKEIIRHYLETEDEKMIDKIFDKVYQGFVQEVDGIDNGIPSYTGKVNYLISTNLSTRVENLKPFWNDPIQDYEKGFYKAMDLVRTEFSEKVLYFSKIWWPAQIIVAETFDRRYQFHKSGKILDFGETFCPFKQHIFDLEVERGKEGEILFAIFQSQGNDWRVLAMPDRKGDFTLRMKLLWCGLRENELSEASGIPDCIFVHVNGFIGGNKTREGALQMAVKTLETMNQNKNSS